MNKTSFIALLFDWKSYSVVDWILFGVVIVALINFIATLVVFYITEIHNRE